MPEQKVKFRAVELGDIEHFMKWVNDPEVTYFLEALIYPMSRLAEEKVVQRMASGEDSANKVFIVETLDGTYLGNVGLHHIDWRSRVGELGIAMGDKAMWNQGYGTAAVKAMVDFAFREMNMHRVYLRVYAGNQRAIRVYEKAGFKHEGRLREGFYAHGNYDDVVLMGILRREWE